MQKLTRRHFLRDTAAAGGFLTLTGSLASAEATETSGKAASADPPNDAGERALDSALFRRAVEAGDLERVRWFLDRDPALAHSRDAGGRSAFILAHLAGYPEVAETLREHGLQLDVVEAAIAPDWDRVREICEVAPGTVNLPHPFGGTAVHGAALFGHWQNIWVLQQFGADLNANPSAGDGVTPVRIAFDNRERSEIAPTVGTLLGNSGEVNAAQKDGDSVLHAAAADGDPYLVRLVLRKHGDPTARNAVGETPLEVAQRLGNDAAVELLRHPERVPRDHVSSRLAYDASGGRFELPPPSGLPQTLINRVVGASHGHFEVVRELTERHPELMFSISSADEMTVEACAHTGRREIVQFYLDHGAPLSLLTAITMGMTSRARELLRQDPLRVHERGPHDFPLSWYPVIGGGVVEAMELLIEYGVDLEAERLGETVLHRASRSGQIELVELLLEEGTEVNARRLTDQQTPLDEALRREHTAIVDLLRRHGGQES